MATAAINERKKKKPPTFQHLPADRAKKLKKSWVETQKIKSQWKAEKRKAGLLQRDRAPHLSPEETTAVEKSTDPREDGDGHRSNQERDIDSEPADDSTGSPSDDETDDEPPATLSKGQSLFSKKPQARPSQKRQRTDGQNVAVDEDDEKPSLRELTRKAYSQSSLHSYKSDPLHKRNGVTLVKDAGHRRGGGGTHRGRGRAGEGGRGRGQPDMRLRMNVMLEKIKRDLS